MTQKITRNDLKGFICRYHRNGTDGNGFYYCGFRFSGVLLVATLEIEDCGDASTDERIAFRRNIRVVDPERPSARYDGPDFEQALRDSVERFAREQGDLLHACCMPDATVVDLPAFRARVNKIRAVVLDEMNLEDIDDLVTADRANPSPDRRVFEAMIAYECRKRKALAEKILARIEERNR